MEKIDVNMYCDNRYCPERSVHFGKRKRFDKAKSEFDRQTVKKEKIVEWTNEFLKACGLEICPDENIVYTENIQLDNFNKNIQKKYPKITSEKDIIWMKFTNEKYLGVVACSNDINFDIPSNESEYDKPEKIVDGKIKSWTFNTSGIIIHSLHQEWDTSYFLLFPLIGLSDDEEGKKMRHRIETGVGNYLISKGVPILDFYSHRL